MAVRRISNAGGLYSNPTTWVGGIVPFYPDTVGFTATSGNLTVDMQDTIGGIDFTNYVGTMDMLVNAGLSIADDGITAGFINMGSGGYTLTDSGGNGFIEASGVFPTIITNTVGKINPYRFNGGYLAITGDWLQQGVMDDYGFLYQMILTSGTFTMLGTQNFAFGLYIGSTSSSTNVYFNGNITITDLQIDTGTYKVIGGTFSCPNIFAENIAGNIILDFNGHLFLNSGLSGNTPNTIQLDSVLDTDTLSMTGTILLEGAFGFNTNVLSKNYFSTGIFVFKSAVEYFINNQLDMTNATFSASTPGTKAKLTLGQNIDQLRVVNIIATDIDSSSGRRVNNFYGTATNCDNWRIWVDNTLPQVPSTF